MKLITNWILEWDTLTSIRTAPFIRSMYGWVLVVPVVAKVFQKIEEVVRLTVFGYEFELHLSLPFSWQIFFWCALSFGLSNALTLIFAPIIIKENKSFADFQAAGKGDVHLSQYAENVNGSHTPYNWESYAPSHEIQWDNYRAFLRDKFWELFNSAKVGRPHVRGVCSICYLVGFVFLAWLLISNIVWVLKYLIS